MAGFGGYANRAKGRLAQPTVSTPSPVTAHSPPQHEGPASLSPGERRKTGVIGVPHNVLFCSGTGGGEDKRDFISTRRVETCERHSRPFHQSSPASPVLTRFNSRVNSAMGSTKHREKHQDKAAQHRPRRWPIVSWNRGVAGTQKYQ